MHQIMHDSASLCQALSCAVGTKLRDNLISIGSMKKSTQPAETLADNLRWLISESGIKIPKLSEKSGVSVRMIQYILAGERKPTIEIAENLAKAFKLTGWMLILPSLNSTLAKNGSLAELIDNYSKADDEGRSFISKVAQKEAKYGGKS
jgi:transcriptional regulator with XRE-family HTH domain